MVYIYALIAIGLLQYGFKEKKKDFSALFYKLRLEDR